MKILETYKEIVKEITNKGVSIEWLYNQLTFRLNIVKDHVLKRHVMTMERLGLIVRIGERFYKKEDVIKTDFEEETIEETDEFLKKFNEANIEKGEA